MTLKVFLPAKLGTKRQCAPQRCEERLNKKYPYRKTLRSDLDKLSFTSESRPRISQLLGDPNFEPSTKRALEAVDDAITG